MNVYKLCRLFLVVVVLVLVSPMASGYAQGPGGTSNEEQMQQMLDMIKGMSKGAGQGKGMDERTQKQLENMFKGMGQKMDKRQVAQTKKEQEQFETETVGHGTAIVEVEGKRYDLTVTTCELWGGDSREFKIEARQPPAKGAWKLSMRAGKSSRVGLTFQVGRKKGYWREGTGSVDKSSSLTVKDNGLQWTGLVDEKDNVPITIQVTCGAEMVNYSKPANPGQNTSPHVLTLSLGKEIYTFQIGYCSTEAYRTGNLMVEFDVTAMGTFRGSPAILFLSKSHPVGSQGRDFEELELLLGELTAEQRTLPPLKVKQELDEKVNAFSREANAAIQKKYDKERAVIQEKYGKDVPPDKAVEATEAYLKMGDAQGKEMDKVREQVKAMRFPEAKNNGTFTINGKEVLYKGPRLRILHGKDVPQFKNLEGIPEVLLTCET